MVAYFVIGMALAAALCFGAYWVLQQRVLEEMLTLDDGKGYYLVACILIGFMLALGGFYTGQALGFDQQVDLSVGQVGFLACIKFLFQLSLLVHPDS